MATLYPNPLPCRVDADPMRAAEREVYAALGVGLGQDYSVFYGVAWLARDTRGGARDGEVDFVVAHAERGVLLLEVKGGRVCREAETGRWTSIDRQGFPHPIHDPFAQVRQCKHALLEKLKEHPAIGHAWVPMGHGVVLPDSANPHRPLGPDGPPEITVFADDMARIGERVAGMFDYWNARAAVRRPACPRLVPVLTEVLAPTFDLRQPLGAVLADDDREILRLTEQQFAVLDRLSRQRRVSVIGGAGTGKTVLALEKAKRLAREGFRVLLTCFNRPLADHLWRSAGAIEGLTVLTFHQLCSHFATEGRIDLPDYAGLPAPPEFYEVVMPNAMLAALDRVEQRFDAVIVDEGQDFLESWWDPLQFALADPERGVLYVFHDDNQRVYRRVPSFPNDLFEIPLNDNLRNTRRIHAATSRFYHGEPLRASGPEGREVEYVEVESSAAIEGAVGEVLRRLLEAERVPLADIAVLLGWSESSPLRKDTHIGAFPVTRDPAAEPGKVLLDSVRRFKGLERPVVILTAIDGLPPDEEDALLYVGLSRARVQLIVVATRATMERLRLG